MTAGILALSLDGVGNVLVVITPRFFHFQLEFWVRDYFLLRK